MKYAFLSFAFDCILFFVDFTQHWNWDCDQKTFLCLQVVVQHVNIQGLGRTKEDLLGYEISDVFHAKNLIDVCIYDHILN